MFGHNPTNHNRSRIGLNQARKRMSVENNSGAASIPGKGHDLVNHVDKILLAINSILSLNRESFPDNLKAAWENLERLAIRIGLERTNCAIYFAADEVDVNSCYFGMVVKRFIEYLTEISELLGESDVDYFRNQLLLQLKNLEKILNQLQNVSVDHRVLQFINATQPKAKQEAAEALIGLVRDFYGNLSYFFRIWVADTLKDRMLVTTSKRTR